MRSFYLEFPEHALIVQTVSGQLEADRKSLSLTVQSRKTFNKPCFNPVEFDGIRKDAGLNRFILRAKQWIERIHPKRTQPKCVRK